MKEKDRKFVVFYLFVHKNTDIFIVLSVLIFATLMLQVSAEKFSQIGIYLKIINLLVFIAGLFSVYILRRPDIRVRND